MPSPSRQKYYGGRVDGQCGSKTLAAITAFATDHRLADTTKIQPNSEAHKQLATKAAAAIFAQPTTQRPRLTYNGQQLCWVGPPHNGRCWEGVSGAIGHQSPENQNERDKGPIPEGVWEVRQDQYQKYDEIPLFKKLLAPFGRGTWQGGTISWGRHRVWLLPKKVPNLYGRSNFSIHGGNHPGSAGCIDLTFKMSDFAKAFDAFGADMELTVDYSK